jgi:hypothetical protein
MPLLIFKLVNLHCRLRGRTRLVALSCACISFDALHTVVLNIVRNSVRQAEIGLYWFIMWFDTTLDTKHGVVKVIWTNKYLFPITGLIVESVSPSCASLTVSCAGYAMNFVNNIL